ncbi:2694_t:CDS:2 [Entrophospora sp. SA101]|nr:2694_t:CDS:2 [Entrophospora sp. SA101]
MPLLRSSLGDLLNGSICLNKTSLIAKLDDDIKEIKQGHSEKETLTYCETPEQINDKSNSDIYQKSITQCYASPIHTETKSLEEKEYDEFLESEHRKNVDDLPETEVCVPTTASIPLTHIPNSSGPDDFPEVELSESTITPIPSAHISKSSGLGDLPKTQGFNSDFSDNDEVNNWSATYSDNDDEAGYYWNPSTGKKIYKESMELTCSA